MEQIVISTQQQQLLLMVILLQNQNLHLELGQGKAYVKIMK